MSPFADLSSQRHGGPKRGGGAELTSFEREVIDRYRDMQAKAEEAVADHVRAFATALTRSAR